ncbi:MAG: recombinase family protein, partial [Candidatus Coproplasma sp.]
MRAVIYARYSSDNQREESIEGQLRECMEFANRAEIDVIGNYIDRALSAKSDNRPEFQRMIKDSYKHAFDCIIVWKLDRFSRNRYDSAHYKALLRKNGVKVISAMESISEGSEGILLESVLEGMAEYYSAELAEKVVRGMKENTLKGINNGGQVTFGYKLNAERKFEPNETTAPIVEEIFTMYADGKTVKQIVDYLDEKGIRSYRGGKLNINSVQRILSNRRYIGEYKFREVVVPHCIPALVSDELFERVQKKLIKNKKAPARHKAEDDYLLTLKLFCGKCGAHMVGESGMGTSKVYHYYKCANTKKVHICDKKAVRKEWIEDLVVKKAMEILHD